MRSATPWRDKLFLWLGLGKKHTSFLPAGIYSEMEYRDLVRRESKRSERSGHLCWILLVYCTNAQELVVSLESELAGKMISVLSMSIRDTDYVGWYRQGRILGVLLTTLASDSSAERCDNLKTRVMTKLGSVLTSTDGHSLQIRVLDESELTTFNAVDHSLPASNSKD